MILTAGTDGHVAFYHPQENAGLTDTVNSSETRMLERNSMHKIHQNTIHCIQDHRLSDGSSLLFTGGDDNALGISRYYFENPDVKPIGFSSLVIPRAHTAAVTGLVVLPLSGRSDSFWVVTGSIDQRLKLWEVVIDVRKRGVEGIEVRKLKNVFTPVADVSSLALMEVDGEPAIVVCGVGIDVWKIRRC